VWNLLEEGFTPPFGDDLYRLVDFYHLTEKLGAAAHVLEDSAAAAAERLGGWKKALLHRSRAATVQFSVGIRSMWSISRNWTCTSRRSSFKPSDSRRAVKRSASGQPGGVEIIGAITPVFNTGCND